ncbi:ABC transporter permease [Gallaecimonas xiamenensis]|uniref:Transport permease protein n=1 Tax=Gallaecimonas xiamenensis 3-C-1 TaxID=745411 RepID=K2JAN9_9GAMM|nr:ABC transporter permease [Gallaecimonas xiamenensis]EKE72163.1 ABC transporter [Gallaecimonas xiamenensis 3-C-1]
MWLRIGAILIKELKQLARDRLTFGMIVMIPLVQLMLFGYAINTDVRHLPAGLVDMSQTSYSRALVQAVEATQVVDFDKRYYSATEAEAALTRGDIKAVLYLPADFGQRLLQYQQQSTAFSRPLGQWLVDGSDTLVASAIKALRQMPLEEVTGQAATRPAPSLELVQYFNPEQRTVVNIVPGLLGVILTMTMVLFTSAAIVREREQGNMEFLITTPVRPLELMLGKIAPYILVGFIQVAIILGTGHWLFGVPVRGGLDSLALASLLFIFASLTLGLVISTLAKTQLQAMQMTVFVLLPSILLSGFMFPYEAMPKAAQWIAEGLPATHYMRMVRAVVLRDAEVSQLHGDALWLLGFTALGLMVATLKFRKRLD